MAELTAVVNDILVIFFDLMVYTKMVELKRDTKLQKGIMYGGCILIVTAYFFCAYALDIVPSIATITCMTLPSLVLFFYLSKHKDARFLLTFCFVDTVTLILGFFSRVVGVLAGQAGGLLSLLVLFLLLSAVYFKGRGYFPRYRELLNCTETGWRLLAVSAVLIYFMLLFTAVYPAALIHRSREYLLVYGVICIAVLSFYAVFLSCMVMTKRLYDQSQQLQMERKWHDMAYVDALTGLKNRMAYIERKSTLERELEENSLLFAVMLDIDDFKAINDTFGHHIGDECLKKATGTLLEVFSGEGFEVFRIGGDEFAVICEGKEREEMEKRMALLKKAGADTSITLSAGYAMVRPAENNAVDNAFIRADKRMYAEKLLRKQG